MKLNKSTRTHSPSITTSLIVPVYSAIRVLKSPAAMIYCLIVLALFIILLILIALLWAIYLLTVLLIDAALVIVIIGGILVGWFDG